MFDNQPVFTIGKVANEVIHPDDIHVNFMGMSLGDFFFFFELTLILRYWRS